ncbi:hypothetical protein [Lysinibacillus sp. FSL K6-3209]|uniref:hypothetical protein n=1 Tax=Lysinibacillus sp. FSL K6-3209 TaxID=2921497 RepID=UPI0030DA13BF
MIYISNKKTRDSAEQSSKSSNDVLEKISVVESKTQDKQRLVEVISSQRVEWINNVRTLFAEFNTNSYIFTSSVRQSEVQKIKPSSEVNSIIPNLIFNVEMLELYFNPAEVVSQKLIKACTDIINELSNATIKMTSPYEGAIWPALERNYNINRLNILYYQQVILKSEWKRVKIETDTGKQLSKKQMLKIFKEVAEALNADKYKLHLKEELEKNLEKIELEERYMGESTEINNSTQSEFISDLVLHISKDDKKLKKFIDENLFPLNSKGKGDITINNNINALKTMDPNQQLLVKGRAKHFEETNDPSKYFPALIAMIAILLPVYALINQLTVDKTLSQTIIIFFNIFLFLGTLLYVARLYFNSVRMRSSAVYFNSLVTNIKYDNEK